MAGKEGADGSAGRSLKMVLTVGRMTVVKEVLLGKAGSGEGKEGSGEEAKTADSSLGAAEPAESEWWPVQRDESVLLKAATAKERRDAVPPSAEAASRRLPGLASSAQQRLRPRQAAHFPLLVTALPSATLCPTPTQQPLKAPVQPAQPPEPPVQPAQPPEPPVQPAELSEASSPSSEPTQEEEPLRSILRRSRSLDSTRAQSSSGPATAATASGAAGSGTGAGFLHLGLRSPSQSWRGGLATASGSGSIEEEEELKLDSQTMSSGTQSEGQGGRRSRFPSDSEQLAVVRHFSADQWEMDVCSSGSDAFDHADATHLPEDAAQGLQDLFRFLATRPDSLPNDLYSRKDLFKDQSASQSVSQAATQSASKTKKGPMDWLVELGRPAAQAVREMPRALVRGQPTPTDPAKPLLLRALPPKPEGLAPGDVLFTQVPEHWRAAAEAGSGRAGPEGEVYRFRLPDGGHFRLSVPSPSDKICEVDDGPETDGPELSFTSMELRRKVWPKAKRLRFFGPPRAIPVRSCKVPPPNIVPVRSVPAPHTPTARAPAPVHSLYGAQPLNHLALLTLN